MNDLISVIVPMYNSEEHIQKCLNSILNQTYGKLEVIVINDGSSDNSEYIVKDIMKKDTRIKCITIKNSGVSEARNVGLRMATGKYVTFVDSDDYIENNMYEILINLINKNDIDLSICNFIIEKLDSSNHTKKSKVAKKDYENITVFTNDEFFEKVLASDFGKGYSCNKLFKLAIIKDNNLQFDKNIKISEDLLFVCNYLKYCKMVTYINKKLYHYVIRNVSAYNGKFSEKWLTGLATYEQLKYLYKDKDRKSQDMYIFSYVCYLIELKKKILLSSDQKCIEKHKYVFKELNKNFKKMLKSKNIPIKLKMKLCIKQIYIHISRFYNK